MDKNQMIAQIQEMVQESGFEQALQLLSTDLGDQITTLLDGFKREFERIRISDAPLGLRIIDEFSSERIAQFDAMEPAARGRAAKRLVMESLVALPSRLEQSSLPLAILCQYVVAAGYIRTSTLDEDDTAYGDRFGSYFDRDLRVCELFTVPAGAQIVDQNVWIPESFYRYKGIKENLRSLGFIKLKLGGLGPLFRVHTDTRNLVDFNEEGWNQCYVRIAELLEKMPEVRGMVGTSWFYDPQLTGISPRLSYLQNVPLSAGAFLKIDGPGEIHTERAVTRSPTRKRLYEEGKYKPVCATLVWPRKSLIAWAKRRKSV